MIKQYLKDPDSNPPKEIEYYLRGNCDVFAVAINRLFKWDIFALVDDRFYNGKPLGIGVTHAFNSGGHLPLGSIIDAKGIRDANDLKNEYPFDKSTQFKHFTEEEIYLLVNKEMPGVHPGTSLEDYEILVQTAMVFVQKYYLHFKDPKC